MILFTLGVYQLMKVIFIFINIVISNQQLKIIIIVISINILYYNTLKVIPAIQAHYHGLKYYTV